MSETAVLKERAKAQLAGKWGTMTLIWLIVWGIGLIPTVLSVLLSLGGVFANLPGSIISAVITTWSTLTWCAVSLKVAKGEPVVVKDAFCALPRLLSAVCTDFLMGLFLFLWLLAGFVPVILLTFISPFFVLLLIPATIPFIMKAYAYSQTFYVMMDLPDISGTEPITYSKELMDGNKMALFWLGLTFLGWSLLTSLTLGLLSIYTTPYINTTYANFYLDLNSGPDRTLGSLPTPTSTTDAQWRDMAP